MTIKAEDFTDAPQPLVDALKDEKVVAALATYVDTQKKGVDSKNKELLTTNKDLKDFIESLGGTDALKQLAADKAAADQKAKDALAKSNDVEAVRSTLQSEIKTRDDQIAKLLGEKKNNKLRSVISDAVKDANADAVVLGPHIEKRITAELDGDDVKIVVTDKDGKPWMVGTDAKPATLKNLLEEMKKDPSLSKGFNAVGAGGTGSDASTDQKGVVNPWNKATWNVTEQGRQYQANPERATALAAAAGIRL
jgi:hypothetical protein